MARWSFYYDGDCGFCSWVVRWLRRTDFVGGVEWVPYQSLERPPGDLSWEDLDRSAYLDAGKAQLYEGYYAFRKLTLKVPALIPLAPVFWLPGVAIPGVRAYRWVARNRYRISRCGLPARHPALPGEQSRPPDDAG